MSLPTTNESAVRNAKAILGSFSVIASWVVGIGAIAYAIGAIYLRAFFRELGAAWVFEFVPATSLLRAPTALFSVGGMLLLYAVLLAAISIKGWSWKRICAAAFLLLAIPVIFTIFARPKGCETPIWPYLVAAISFYALMFTLVTLLRIKEWPSYFLISVLVALFGCSVVGAELSAKATVRNLSRMPEVEAPRVVLRDCESDCKRNWHVIRAVGEGVLLGELDDENKPVAFRIVEQTQIASIERAAAFDQCHR